MIGNDETDVESFCRIGRSKRKINSITLTAVQCRSQYVTTETNPLEKIDLAIYYDSG